MTGAELKWKMQDAGQKIWTKAKRVGGRAIECGKNGIKWAMENPEKAAGFAAAGAAVLGGANKVVRSVHRNVTVRHELEEKRRRIYDHSAGMYLYTKRPLKANEIVRINEERRKNGKKVSEILAEMDLLKR